MKTKPFLVMHVEDDDHHADLIGAAIEQSHSRWSVIRFIDAESGLDYLFGQLQTGHRTEYPYPNLILLDLTLPGMPGLDFAGQVRRQPSTRTIPIVAISEIRDVSDVKHAYHVGINTFIEKPARIRELVIKLAELNTYWSATASVPDLNDSTHPQIGNSSFLSSVCTCTRKMGSSIDLPCINREDTSPILIVESDEKEASRIRQILSSYTNWMVDTAPSLSSALDALKLKRYHAVVIDYELADGCGLDLKEWMRDDCGFILLALPNDARSAVQAIQSGVTQCVVRDALLELVLPSAIENWLQRSKQFDSIDALLTSTTRLELESAGVAPADSLNAL